MKINEIAIDVLTQLNGVIEQLDDDQYTAASMLLGNSTIGKHVRHTIEFFTCAMDSREYGLIDYDLRKRDMQIEASRIDALRLIDTVIDQLNEVDQNQVLELQCQYGENEAMQVRLPTNFLRELVYNIEHAVHHMALIRVGIKEQRIDIDLPDSFGVASSTLRHHQPLR